MKKILILLVVFVALIGLGVLIVQGYSEGVLPEKDSSEGNLITGDESTAKDAEGIRSGGCWYRDEFGRLFNVNEPHHNVVAICLRRGDYPSKILVSDQQALGLTDTEVEAMGYIKISDGNWER